MIDLIIIVGLLTLHGIIALSEMAFVSSRHFRLQEKFKRGNKSAGLALRLLEKLDHPIKAACFVGTPIGVRPIANYDRDNSFSGFSFDWGAIKEKSKHFVVFQSDDDPYVGLENGQGLANNLGVELTFVPKAGHFNKRAGYVKFEKLRDMILEILKET